MTHFFSTSQSVNVSRITSDGWWIENTVEHVAKGTALGTDFTENIYTPSNEEMIARYDRELDVWSDEIKNMTWKAYWDKHGQRFVVGEPDGDFPEWAIKVEPPRYDSQTQTVLYKDKVWRVNDILIGTPYYNEYGIELLVSDFNFELPERHTWNVPPDFDKETEQLKLDVENDAWIISLKPVPVIAYNKETKQPKEFDDKSLVTDEFTMKEPLPYSTWQNNDWVQKINLLQTAKQDEINRWRDGEETQTPNIIMANGIEWDVDPVARQRINEALISTIKPPFWTDANNVNQPDYDLQAMLDAYVQRGFEIHARQRQMKEEIKLINDFEELKAYQVGWYK